ncbi:putative oxidoreductase [Rosa chinensis]|uniref:Putative oxidoreductase n=1 Tax=Rosa chinensis TaxID=74649 RepID=A0A2P6QG60_ROSCH|nr:putative oxidoreductase [Rosa chinensis]
MFLKICRSHKTSNLVQRLPPGPWKLPIIGNMHQLVGSLPHHILRDLANIYGPLMHLQLGEVSTVVVSTPEAAKEIMRTHDGIFAFRPLLLAPDQRRPWGCSNGAAAQGLRTGPAPDIISYGGAGIAFAPYGEYWRQMRKICYSVLLNSKRVESFQLIREEVSHLLEFIRANIGSPINLGEQIFSMTYGMTTRVAFSNKCKEHEALITSVREGSIVAFQDLFATRSETSSSTVEWAMSEMVKTPRVKEKAQAEVGQVFGAKGNVNETSLQQLKFLKVVIKETLRLHPPLPLLLPKECSDSCEINGYGILVKIKVIVNAWVIGREPKHWTEAETFHPERFLDSCIDHRGANIEFIPFGAGRRICPGMSFATLNIELPLARLLFHFNWKLPEEGLDMTENFGATVQKKKELHLIPTPYPPVPNV